MRHASVKIVATENYFGRECSFSVNEHFHVRTSQRRQNTKGVAAMLEPYKQTLTSSLFKH